VLVVAPTEAWGDGERKEECEYNRERKRAVQIERNGDENKIWESEGGDGRAGVCEGEGDRDRGRVSEMFAMREKSDRIPR
jgi:hypothetical protein